MMKLSLKRNRIVFFFLVFLPVGTIGTVLHELGHFVVGQYYGYKPQLHYGMVTLHDNGNTAKELDKIHLKNKEAIKQEKDFPDKKKWDKLYSQWRFEYSLITWGGVLQTLFTGTLGFFLLWWSRRKQQWQDILLKREVWFIIMALFWSREVANLLMALSDGSIDPNSNWDEVKISISANLPFWFFPILLGVLGLLVCMLVVFRFCPPSYRKELFIGGVLGSVIGGIIWLGFLGKLILP